MKAIILSAGQGRRLLPKTANTPKCALKIGDRSVIEWQIDTLLDGGIESIIAVVGYGGGQVRDLLKIRYGTDQVCTIENPLYKVADNLVSCWTARHEMDEDFILLNGDTLFEPAVLERLLNSPMRPITLSTFHKSDYDADDMKVILDGTRLLRVGKKLPLAQVNGESLGMTLFRNEGSLLFRATLERMVQKSEAFKQWYLSVIDEIASSGIVWTQPMTGLEWTEIDDLEDLKYARNVVPYWTFQDEPLKAVAF